MDSLKTINVILTLFPWQLELNQYFADMDYEENNSNNNFLLLLSFIVILGWLWCCILAPRCQLWQVLEIIPFVQQFRHLSVRNHLSHNMMTEDFPNSF